MVKYGLAIILAISTLCAIPFCGAESDLVLETISGNAQMSSVPALILTSPQGVTAFVDVNHFDERCFKLSEDPKSLFAQTFRDRSSEGFHAFPSLDHSTGLKLIGQTGVITSGDIRVEGISASRFDNDVDGSDIIFIIEAAGRRIVHLGDCGQDTLTQDQMEKIGRVDVAVIAVEWINSELSVGNKKAFRLLKQINPTIVIPTHILSTTAVKLLDTDWPCEALTNGRIILNSTTLAKRRTIFWGDNLALARKTGLPEN